VICSALAAKWRFAAAANESDGLIAALGAYQDEGDACDYSHRNRIGCLSATANKIARVIRGYAQRVACCRH